MKFPFKRRGRMKGRAWRTLPGKLIPPTITVADKETHRWVWYRPGYRRCTIPMAEKSAPHGAGAAEKARRLRQGLPAIEAWRQRQRGVERVLVRDGRTPSGLYVPGMGPPRKKTSPSGLILP